jgi:hypothetical protein
MKTVSPELNLLNKAKPKEKMSYEDFLAWCDEDTWAEWVDGIPKSWESADSTFSDETRPGFARQRA